MKMKAILVILVFSVLVTVKTTLATQYLVGGSQGWELSVDYVTWLSDKSFKVGDELVFQYSSRRHSVLELGSATAFQSCDLRTPIISLNSGRDVFLLSETGTRYFVCGTPGHCEQGMRLKVSVVSSSNSTPAFTLDSDSGHGLHASTGIQ